MILIIDNYDSFVFNIARYLVELGAEVRVVRNDAITCAGIAGLRPEAIVVSPGPCAPGQAGISCDLVREYSGEIPILGICLGHQVIGETFGGKVVRARKPLHGQAAPLSHDGTGLFAGLPTPMLAGRYHSLVVELDDATVPLIVNARSQEGEIMALTHQNHPTWGVQFHPESIVTEHGFALLRNFLDSAQAWRRA